jgi:hypothetical protein
MQLSFQGSHKSDLKREFNNGEGENMTALSYLNINILVPPSKH